jgi:hypothetical protein
MVRKRRAVVCGHCGLDAMPTGTCELRERGWEVLDGRVAVTDEEDPGARRGVPRIPAASLCRQPQHQSQSHDHRRHGRERDNKPMPSMAGTAWRAPDEGRRAYFFCRLVGYRAARGQAHSTPGTDSLTGAVPRPALTAYRIRHEVNPRITASTAMTRPSGEDLRTSPPEPQTRG